MALAVEHGGRSITTHMWGGNDLNALVYSTPSWTVQQRTPVIPNSGFARSTEGFSHDGDTAVAARPVGTPTPTHYEFYLSDSTFSQQLTAAAVVPPGGFGGKPAYDPTRTRFLMPTWSSQSSSAAFYLFTYIGSTWNTSPLGLSYPGRSFWTVGISEDGTEARILSMDSGSFQGQCYIDWVSLRAADLGTVRRTVTIPKNPPPGNGNCSGDGAIGNRIANGPSSQIGAPRIGSTRESK